VKLTNNQIGRIQLVFQAFEEIKQIERRAPRIDGCLTQEDLARMQETLDEVTDDVIDWTDLNQISQALKSAYNGGGKLVYRHVNGSIED
jgi:hypothetical protein